MRIFISGIAGFLGSHLADAMIGAGHHVVGVDSLIGGYLDNVPPKAEFFEQDCNDLEPLRERMRGVDIVYHCAATAHEGLSVFSPHLVTTSVVSGTSAMLAAACDARVSRFVFLSSMARYGSSSVPFDESMPPMPQDPYAIGKVAAEDLVKNLCTTHGIDWVIAVPHNIYGPRQKYDDPFRNVAAIFANLLLQGKQPFVYGDGSQKRSFSFIDDVVDPLALMAISHRVVGEVVNLGPDDEFVSILELAERLADVVDVPLRPTMLPPRPQEVKLAYCSSAKARRLLGYESKTGLADGLRLLVQWISMRGPLPFDYRLPIEIKSDKTPSTWSQRLM